MLDIEVLYAKPDRQFLIALQMPPGSTVKEAVEASGLLTQCPEIGEQALTLGIFGQVRLPNCVLKTGDRVEIYRPLINDPKEARRQRAIKK
jgi:putative ubiquitin-RnfH superfamily antitoxin RatB of RatAB toxin-antitoxin module